MEISKFKDIVSECKDLTFRQIWEIYDAQFNELRDAIHALGDKIVVETFTNGEKVLNLTHKYINNHTIVYWNDVIQWKGIDYEETDNRTITMLHNVNDKDIIKVVIILNDMLIAENALNIEHIREVVEEELDGVLEEKINQIIDSRIEEYLTIHGFINSDDN